MYGRWYAQLNREKGSDLLYQNGSQVKWYRKFMATIMSARVQNIVQSKILRKSENRDTSLTKERLLQRRLRTNSEFATGLLRDLAQNMVDPQSNIPGNYGILFGIRDVAVTQDLSIADAVRKIETRSLTDIN